MSLDVQGRKYGQNMFKFIIFEEKDPESHQNKNENKLIVKEMLA